MNRERLTAIALSAVLASGCSSTPRTFTPQLTAAPDDSAAYEEALATCQQQSVVLGRGRTTDRIANGAGTATAGGMVAGGASYGAAAVAGAVAVVAVPVMGVVWGITRANRSKKERRIKEASGRCLMEQGYTVASWQRVKRPRHAEQAKIEEARLELPLNGESSIPSPATVQ
ncbi:hypothetical protein [Novosphingobium album (ex Hu et al. 2023)]|uniref:Glycine zipper family protein n=1 Tax=Novosphingobium album (ex Hu et al. 2023) TaxID=2930093 RepID=A0ABT0B4Y7_9SPHN|nr:hypothetical protein [Novosphingobium album (ex Hu et al. 2023)]MCJ2179943.1 hypothetical protein [Novosphingobium album (ex Hu et al. 2023)]